MIQKRGVGMEKENNSIKKRGRPATGQKAYKTVAFRLEEQKYDNFEMLAQREAGISVHTFIKSNLEKIFFNRESKAYIPIEKEFLYSLNEVDSEFAMELSEILERVFSEYIFRKILKKIIEEYHREKMTYYEEGVENPTFLGEIFSMIQVFLETPTTLDIDTYCVRATFRELLFQKIKRFLETKPSNNKTINSYFEI